MLTPEQIKKLREVIDRIDAERERIAREGKVGVEKHPHPTG